MQFDPDVGARFRLAGRSGDSPACAGDARAGLVRDFESDREARVESPCIRHCTLDDDDICLGCFRSIDEICAWAAAGNDDRRQILAAALARRRQRELDHG